MVNLVDRPLFQRGPVNHSITRREMSERDLVNTIDKIESFLRRKDLSEASREKYETALKKYKKAAGKKGDPLE